MAVLSELRYPTTRIAKLLSALVALALFCVVAVASISGFLLYQVLRPARTPASFDLGVMMGHPTAFSFTAPTGVQREGWFFPGLRGAPTVIVSHGYLSQRADVLTLAAALQEHEFNAFVFDYTAHGSTPGVTSLGYREVGELESAVQALSSRDDVDPKHFGLWGVDLGAYAALGVAVSDRRIAALAVDSAYDSPRDMLEIQVHNSGLSGLPFITHFSDFGFRMLNYQYRRTPSLSGELEPLRGVPKLFIESGDRSALAAETGRLAALAPDPKQVVQERVSYRDMADDDRKAYENLIVTFFVQYIPPEPH
jgi:hypothetical protein